MHKTITIDNDSEKALIAGLEGKTDIKSERLKRVMALPDLSRTQGSPIADLVKRIVGLSRFKKFDTLKVPEIVSYDISFDLFNHSFGFFNVFFYCGFAHILFLVGMQI